MGMSKESRIAAPAAGRGRRELRIWVAMFGVGVFLLAGCGGGPKLVTVSGRVTMGGKPLANATVNFEPVAASGGAEAGGGSYGRTDADGRYSLKYVLDDRAGAVVGEHRVTITSVGEAASDAGGVADPIPAQFRDGSLKYQVPESGAENANFDL